LDSQGQAVFPGDTVTAMPDCDVGSRVKFTGTVHRFVLGDVRGLLVEVSDQYRDLFDCLPGQIVLKSEWVDQGLGLRCRKGIIDYKADGGSGC
jgi:hypothetical protein